MTTTTLTTTKKIYVPGLNIYQWIIYFEGQEVTRVPEGDEARRDRMMARMEANADAMREALGLTNLTLAGLHRNPDNGPADA